MTKRLRILFAICFAALALMSLCACGSESTAESEANAAKNKAATEETDSNEKNDSTIIDEQGYEEVVSDEVASVKKVTVEKLVNAKKKLDGALVKVTAEVTGDRINAGNGNYWICIEDVETNSAISVLVSADQAELIENYGRYDTRGDTVTIKGYFHISCAEDGGISDLHASSIKIVEEGGSINHSVTFGTFVLPVLLLAVGILLFVRYRIKKNRGK